MAYIEKLEYNGKMYMFVCSARNTRNGFAHDCELFINDIFAIKQSCFYLNRTWECFRFQSVMLACIRYMITERENLLRKKYMLENNYTRLTAGRKESLQVLCNQDSILQEYKAIENTIRYNMH